MTTSPGVSGTARHEAARGEGADGQRLALESGHGVHDVLDEAVVLVQAVVDRLVLIGLVQHAVAARVLVGGLALRRCPVRRVVVLVEVVDGLVDAVLVHLHDLRALLAVPVLRALVRESPWLCTDDKMEPLRHEDADMWVAGERHVFSMSCFRMSIASSCGSTSERW